MKWQLSYSIFVRKKICRTCRSIIVFYKQLYLTNNVVYQTNKKGRKVKDLVHEEDDDFERACSGRRDSSLAMIFDWIPIY